MSSRDPRIWLQRTCALRGDPRMSLFVWCMLVLVLCGSSKEMVLGKPGGPEGWHSYRVEKRQNIIQDFKRHSDGTFTSDFTQYLDKIKAKDFVEWLASTKREGCHQDMLHIADEV